MNSASKRVSRPMQVRDLRIGDLATAAELVAAIPLWKRYGYPKARCARDLRQALKRRDRLKVAVSEEEILGLAWVLPLGGFGRMPYLKILAVQESARGRGAGAALLKAAEAGGDLLLLVSDFNRRARRFYESHGYRRVGAFPGLVLADVTEILLWKRARLPSAPSRRPLRPGRATGRQATARSRAG